MSPIELNCAVIEAFGLDPKTIRPNPTIVLDKHRGPIITVEHFIHDQDGHKFTDPNGDVAHYLRQYKLVPIEYEDKGP